MNTRADLHIHTNFSDGYYSPTEILEMSSHKGFIAISITDHDNVDGTKVALAESVNYGITVIPGVELSAQLDEKEIHVLGYFFDPHNRQLNEYLNNFRRQRIQRASKIIGKLNSLGFEITIEDVLNKAGNAAVGRPHIAETMVDLGLVNNYYSAFNRYIGDNESACVNKENIPLEDAVKLIKEAGGLSFLAHPGNLIDDIIEDTIKTGIDGIEVIHPSHNSKQVKHFRSIANRYYILTSGGSDYHGGNRNDDQNFGSFTISNLNVLTLKKALLKTSA